MEYDTTFSHSGYKLVWRINLDFVYGMWLGLDLGLDGSIPWNLGHV
jgi:hypothetical protein